MSIQNHEALRRSQSYLMDAQKITTILTTAKKEAIPSEYDQSLYPDEGRGTLRQLGLWTESIYPVR